MKFDSNHFNNSIAYNTSEVLNSSFLNEYNATNSIEKGNNSFLHGNNATNGSGVSNSSFTDGYNGSISANVNYSMTIERLTSRKNELFQRLKESGIWDIRKTSPEYTICQKMSVSERKTIVQYLFDEGKCGKICRKGSLNISYVKLKYIINERN